MTKDYPHTLAVMTGREKAENFIVVDYTESTRNPPYSKRLSGIDSFAVRRLPRNDMLPVIILLIP